MKIFFFFCTGRAAKKARFQQKYLTGSANLLSLYILLDYRPEKRLHLSMSSVGPLTPTVMARSRSRAVITVKTKDKDNDDNDKEDDE